MRINTINGYDSDVSRERSVIVFKGT